MSAFPPAYDAEVGAWYVRRTCPDPAPQEARRYFYDDPEPLNPTDEREMGEDKAWDDYNGNRTGCCG